MRTFFTSDMHFGHANIIKYANRPFLKPGDLTSSGDWISPQIKSQRAREMDAELIKRHNSVVTPNDDVYCLGDFCFGVVDDAVRYLQQLHFKKFYFIWGNHDKAMEALWTNFKNGVNTANLKDKIVWLGNMKEVKINGQSIVLNHYAMKVWNQSHRGVWHLYGHSHGSLPDDPHSLSLDVGVDCHNYTPVSFEQISQLMSKKYWKPIDHHVGRQEGGGLGLNQLERFSANVSRMR